MSSEMRELVAKWKFNLRLLGPDVARRVLESCIADVDALLARTEAGADGAAMAALQRESDKSMGVGFDQWFANPYTAVLLKSIAEDYVPRPHPQDASGDAIDWKWQYRFQTVMRFMDNGATREAAERAALIDIAELENAATQAKEAK